MNKKTRGANPEWFEEFYNSYPCSVIRSNGVKSYIRGNVAKSRVLYDQIVGGDDSKRRLLLRSLNKELAVRTSEGSFPWMKFLINWLRDEEWRQWEESDSTTEVIQTQYGTDVV